MGPLANCPECEKLWADMGKSMPCEQNKCEKPILMPENSEALAVYGLCQSQVLMAPMGGVIGIRTEAVKAAMDLIGVEDQINCLRKINAIVEVFYPAKE
jgi:hypothetical protein